MSLGAQSPIHDLIPGFLLPFEGPIGTRDPIEVGPTAPAVGPRGTKVRRGEAQERLA